MNDKQLNWWHPVMGQREKEFVNQVIESGFPNDGPLTDNFEAVIANITNTKYAVAVTSCTAALYLSLKALGIGYGDEVIVPDITFIAVANAVKMANANPVLVDICPKSFCISSSAIEQAISPHTKAIIPVHVSGRPADLKGILKIANKHNLCVIEDVAEALGSCLNNQPLGSYGTVGCFSFSPAKIITTGQGGMIVTNDFDIYQRLKELKDQGRPQRGTGGNDIHNSIGFNFKYTDLQAAIGLAQLETWSDRVYRLRRHYYLYNENIEQTERLWLPGFDLKSGNCPQWIDIYCSERDALYEYLNHHHVDCRKFWLPIHTQQPYKCEDHLFPGSNQTSRNAMWLPSALTLKDEDIETVSFLINKWAKSKSKISVQTGFQKNESLQA